MKKVDVKRMAGIALLMALVVVLQFVSGILPSISGFNLSLVLIPVIMGAAVYGPGAGALLGGTFGVIVYINCLTGVDPAGAMVFQASPILCFLVVMGKGILAGTAAGYIYKLLKKVNVYVAMLCAAIICPIVNTGIFVACMMTLFKDVLSAWAAGGEIVAYVLSGIVLCNFVPELIINVAFSPAGQRISQMKK